jgi:protein-S-isoprenylcysteine O-methyltransferase Ste14
MDALALIFYLVFFTAAFGWRTWVQWRRTGDTGLRLHAEPGTVQWWAKLAFVLALAAGVAAPIGGLAGLDPLDALDNAELRALGVIVAVAGIGTTMASQLSMGASWRIGVDASERTGLVTTGVFRHVRNPIFTAMSITALGLTLMVGNLVAVAGLVALVAALQLQVRLVEEPYLHYTHSDDYVRYAKSAGRFLPLLGRLREPNQQAPPSQR